MKYFEDFAENTLCTTLFIHAELEALPDAGKQE